jgi:hypothetical protein
VYVAKVKLHQTLEDGKYKNEEYNLICYTLEDALRSIFNCIRGDLMYYQKITDSPTMKDMLLYMNKKTDKFMFCVEEYSTRRERYYSQEELVSRFQEIIADTRENLYDDVLALVDHNSLYYNSFCEQTKVSTIPQKVDGKAYAEGSFTEEDCAEGRYGGDFKYIPADACNENKNAYDGKLYFAFTNIVRKNIDPNDTTYWEPYMECFYSLDDAVKAGIAFYYSKAKEYVPEYKHPNKAFLDDIAKEKFREAYITVRIVSNERIRFESEEELMEYYTDHVLNAKPEEMYDFLLKFVDYDERFYDCNGEYLFSKSCLQGEEYWVRKIPDFSMENAKDICFSTI